MITTTSTLEMKKNKNYNKVKNIIFSIVLLIFLIPMEIRTGIMGRSLGSVNYAANFMLIIFTLTNMKHMNKKYLFFCYSILLYYLISAFFYEKGISSIILVMISHIFPLLFIGIKVNPTIIKSLFKKILITLNIIMIFVTILAFMESLLGINIYIHLSPIMSPRIQELISVQQYRSVYRLYSFMGHPLLNTELYLMMFVLNSVYSKYYSKTIFNKINLITCLFGIGLTASKTGLVLLGIAILFFSYKRSKFKYLIFIFSIILFILSTNIFDGTLQRFMEGSLTSGRSESWSRVIEMNLFPFKFFTGYGSEFTFIYNNYITWASAAFEYPIRMFSLELGILMSLLIYTCIFVIPIFVLVKRKHFYLLIAYSIVFVDVNTYNGLALLGDYMLLFTLFIFIILNVSNSLISTD